MWIKSLIRTLLLFGFLLLISACVTLGDFSSDDPDFANSPGKFEGRFFALSDADMAGTAYADNKLEPLANAVDTLTLFERGAAGAEISAPNSVISWPAVVAVSPDGRFAYVIETFGSLPKDVETVENAYTAFPDGNVLRVFSLEGGLSEQGAPINVGIRPQSVEASGDGRFLVIATEDANAEIVILPLSEDGAAGSVRKIDIDPPYTDQDTERRLRGAFISPDGTMLAVNVANRRIQFYELIDDESGAPQAISPIGAPVDAGVRLAVGKWTPDSRFFVVTDVNAYDSSFAMLTQRGGQVHVVAAPGDAAPAQLIDSVRVGRFAEGLEISDDGTRIASIAMGRTYLPEIWFVENWPKRRTYSLMLLSIDPETGALNKLDEIRAAGVLPEDVIFDETGRNLAVAVFHRRKGEARKRGFIDFFEITDGGTLAAQGRTQEIMRGPHDLARVP